MGSLRYRLEDARWAGAPPLSHRSGATRDGSPNGGCLYIVRASDSVQMQRKARTSFPLVGYIDQTFVVRLLESKAQMRAQVCCVKKRMQGGWEPALYEPVSILLT